jgi:hypothetical protein
MEKEESSEKRDGDAWEVLYKKEGKRAGGED